MSRTTQRVIVRIVLLGIALAMVLWTMSYLNKPQATDNSFFQIFNQ